MANSLFRQNKSEFLLLSALPLATSFEMTATGVRSNGSEKLCHQSFLLFSDCEK